MAANMPAALPGLSTSIVAATPDHPGSHNRVNEEVNAVAAALGTNFQGSFSDLKTRLAATQTCRKTADQTNNTVTLANLTDLSFPIAVGLDYEFEFTIPFSGSAAGVGLGLALTCPTLTGFLAARVDIPRLVEPAVGTAPASDMLYSGAITSSGDVVVADSIPAINTIYIATIKGTLSNASAAGTLQAQFRAEAATSTLTVKKGASGLLRVG